MKPATNLIELYKNLTPSRFLTKEEREFYVKIYDDSIKILRLDLLTQESDKLTIYVSGQSGSGKTTALNFLPNESIDNKFVVFPLMGSELFNLDDVEIVDVLLLLGSQLVIGTPELEDLFKNELQRIANAFEGKYEEIVEADEKESTSKGGEIKGSFGGSPLKWLSIFGVEASAFADYKLNNQKRQVVREVFKPSITELLELTNKIIQEYLILKAPEKELLVVFHEFNHIKKLDKIQELFITNRYYLEGIQARKVITIPVSLIPDSEFDASIFFLGVKTKANRLTNDAVSVQEATQNRVDLKSIVTKRIDPSVTLIDEDAIDKAVELSGGNIRQLISILHYSARKVVVLEGEKLSLNDIEHGAAEMRRILERSMIRRSKIQLLDYVCRHNVVGDSDDKALFREAALSNQIMIYENNSIWYDVNPLIKDTVRVYAASLEAEEEKGG